MLMAPARVDRVATVGFRLDSGDSANSRRRLRRLEEEAKEVLAAMGMPVEEARIDRLGDMRCVGQGSEVTPWPAGA